MEAVWIAAFVLGFAWTVVNAKIASEKNRSVLGAVAMSLLLTPMLSWAYLVAVPVAAPVDAAVAEPEPPRPSPVRSRVPKVPGQDASPMWTCACGSLNPAQSALCDECGKVRR